MERKLKVEVNRAKLYAALAFVNAETTDDIAADARILNAFNVPIDEAANVFNVPIDKVFNTGYSPKSETGIRNDLPDYVGKLRNALHESQYITARNIALEIGLSIDGIAQYIREQFGATMPKLEEDFLGWMRANHPDEIS